jgi:Ca-activated chloride channel homolog
MKYLLSLSLVLALAAMAFITPRTITGKVVDEKGNAVANASIILKGTKIGTTTDANGNFSIKVETDKVVLIASAVAYKAKEVIVKDKTNIIITLEKATENLEEVVVMGYSNQLAKKDMSYSTARATNSIVLRGSSSLSGSYGFSAPLAYKQERNKAYNFDNNDKADTTDTWRYNENFNTEGYERIIENPFLKSIENPLSTFSIDVDAASYSNIRRMLNEGTLPPAGAVRIEEMINYFTYQYPQPTGTDPFNVNTEIATCPWNKNHQLVLIGLQGKKIEMDNLPASNLTFLIDVSGSMNEPNKLPLVQASLKLLIDQLRPQDKIAIVVYAGNAGLVLPATNGSNKIKIKEAIDKLEAGGSTAGGAGIKLAYKIAKENFVKEGNNRVILCTDGDFNVGTSSDDALERLIEEERKSGVFLTVLGYGTGNYQDAKMQKLADKGNGNHAYIDGINEAKKVLVSEFGGTLFTIAKDVKLQIEFNPNKVQGYRLIGYENRMLAKEDFNNDKKDAGELGSGHTVTALYEIIPAGIPSKELQTVDALRYQKIPDVKMPSSFTNEVMNIKLRYKQPAGDESKLLQFPLTSNAVAIENTSTNFRFAAAIAGFGMLLRDSKYKNDVSFNTIKKLAQNAIGTDIEGYRKELVKLIDKASALADKKKDVAKNEEEEGDF